MTVRINESELFMYSIQRLLLNFSLIIVVLGLLGSATPVFACSCAEATPAEQFDNATAVFVGIVKNISEDDGQRSVEFDVSESRKGSVTENVIVTTGWGDADCGFNFETNKEYIVYTRGQGQLSTNICIGTTLLVADVQDSNGENDITDGSETLVEESVKKNNSIVSFAIVAIVSFSVGALITYLVGRKNKAT